MNTTRPRLAEELDDVDAAVAGAPEECEREAYFHASQPFYEQELSPEDIAYVSFRLTEIRQKYELN